MKTYDDQEKKVTVTHNMGEGKTLYGIIQTEGHCYSIEMVDFIVMADSEEDAVKRFKANRKEVKKARKRKSTPQTKAFCIRNPVAIKLPTDRCIPVSYFDDFRSV